MGAVCALAGSLVRGILDEEVTEHIKDRRGSNKLSMIKMHWWTGVGCWEGRTKSAAVVEQGCGGPKNHVAPMLQPMGITKSKEIWQISSRSEKVCHIYVWGIERISFTGANFDLERSDVMADLQISRHGGGAKEECGVGEGKDEDAKACIQVTRLTRPPCIQVSKGCQTGSLHITLSCPVDKVRDGEQQCHQWTKRVGHSDDGCQQAKCQHACNRGTKLIECNG